MIDRQTKLVELCARYELTEHEASIMKRITGDEKGFTSRVAPDEQLELLFEMYVPSIKRRTRYDEENPL